MVPLGSICVKHFYYHLFAVLAGGNTLAYWLGPAVMKLADSAYFSSLL